MPLSQNEIEALGYSFRTSSSQIQALVEITRKQGFKDDANSTTTALGAGGTFTGQWVQNDAQHLAWSAISDQDASLYIDFSIDGSDTLTVLSKKYELIAGESEFDALVKMPGRYHRVRFVNDGGAQTDAAKAAEDGWNDEILIWGRAACPVVAK